ncbi:MAG: TonB-dependent receptor [Gemmatimonadales bacterium]
MTARSACIAGLALLPAVAVAQDSVAVDSTPPVPEAAVGVAFEGPIGPLPVGSRWVFDRDSLVWTSAFTVADLLAEVPGVFTARTGFVQSAAEVGVGGRGAFGVELYWDGIPWQPVGPDSVGPDLSAISLFTLRRVEVQMLPARLRVFLISERHEQQESRSVVRIVSGALRTGGYAGLFQQGWKGGLRLSVAGDAMRTERPEAPVGDRRFDTWARLDWLPAPTIQATWQFRRRELSRDPHTSSGITFGARDGQRTDALLMLRAATRPLGEGWSAGTALRSSGYQDSLFGQRVMREVMVDAGHRGARDELRLRVGLGDGAVRRRADLEAGFTGLGSIVVRGAAHWTRDGFERDSWRTWGTGGFVFGRIGINGEAVRTRAVAHPLLEADTVQRTTDLAVRLAYTDGRLAGRVGVERRGAWSPGTLTLAPAVALRPVTESDWVVAWVRLGPVRAFTITGSYADAEGPGSPDLQPPTHGRVQFTYRNKFWRTFRSGAFDLKIQWSFESWSRGTVGQVGGSAIALPGVTFQEWFVQFEIAGFRAFYSLRNARNASVGYLPGFIQPRNAQTFGVKWEFSS